jgi:hypothetical protein
VKKVLLFGGLAALGYYGYRVWRLNGLHVTTDPNSTTISLSEALKDQAQYALIGAAALLAYKVL